MPPVADTTIFPEITQVLVPVDNAVKVASQVQESETKFLKEFKQIEKMIENKDPVSQGSQKESQGVSS